MRIDNVDVNMKNNEKSSDKIKWYKANDENFSVHGLLWPDVNKNFHRLIDTDELRDNLRFLSSHPSGVYLTFTSNTSSIDLKANVSSASYMSHMTAIGQCGFDLYIYNKGKYIFLSTTKINASEYEINILKDMKKVNHDYLIYFPLYTGFNSLEIGIDNNSILFKKNDYFDEKIVCYGTSISQGGCATRPGMNYTSIIGRNVPYEVFNLGFSGNAFLDSCIAERLKDVAKMKYLILEVEANTDSNGIMLERFDEWLAIVLKNPSIKKVYLITHYPYALSLYKNKLKESMNKLFDYQKELTIKYPIIELIDGKKILKNISYDETVDGIHLTDLGFYVVSKYLINKIKKN